MLAPRGAAAQLLRLYSQSCAVENTFLLLARPLRPASKWRLLYENAVYTVDCVAGPAQETMQKAQNQGKREARDVGDGGRSRRKQSNRCRCPVTTQNILLSGGVRGTVTGIDLRATVDYVSLPSFSVIFPSFWPGTVKPC